MIIGRPSNNIASVIGNNETEQQQPSSSPSWLQIIADGNEGSHVSIIWKEYVSSNGHQAIFLAQSRDGGEIFDDVVQLNPEEKKSDDRYSSSFRPPILLFPSFDSTYVAWNVIDDKNGSLHAALASTKSDGSIAKPTNASSQTIIPLEAAVAGTERSVYVVGSKKMKNTSGLAEGEAIYFSASNDGGSTFADPVDLSDDLSIKMLFAAQNKPYFVAPQIATSGAHVYVAWQAMYPNSSELFFRASSDGGHTFGRTINLTGETSEPVQRGLLLFSESWIYIIIIFSIASIIAVTLGIIFVKFRGGTR
jgi:hypothetical protein